MKDVMTSGEIARKAGVSQKAVRLYDEKGLLKPTDYSEGNYRLYDQQALQILEKIVALKQIGFSLEEIHDSLKASDDMDIEEALRQQVKVMEEKKYYIELVIDTINRTLERGSGRLDWDAVAEMVQSINLDQQSDERHFKALQYTAAELDWYVKIFRSMNLMENQKILDLGCGYAKLWRNNWQQIPKGCQITGYDLHGSWAEDFGQFIAEHKEELPEQVAMELVFRDVEQEETWKQIKAGDKYDAIIAHYLDYELKNVDAFLARCKDSLSADGTLYWNGAIVSDWNHYFKSVLTGLGLESGFVDAKIAAQSAEREEMLGLLQKYFSKTEAVMVPCKFTFAKAEELFEKLVKKYPDGEKVIRKNEKKILEYWESCIAEQGKVDVDTNSEFWHCGV